MERSEARTFRDHILMGNWGKAEAALLRMGMMDEHEMMVRIALPFLTQILFFSKCAVRILS